MVEPQSWGLEVADGCGWAQLWGRPEEPLLFPHPALGPPSTWAPDPLLCGAPLTSSQAGAQDGRAWWPGAWAWGGRTW